MRNCAQVNAHEQHGAAHGKSLIGSFIAILLAIVAVVYAFNKNRNPLGLRSSDGDSGRLKVRVVWGDTGQGIAGTSISIVRTRWAQEEIGGATVTDASGAGRVSFPSAWDRIVIKARHPSIAAQNLYVNCSITTEAVVRAMRGGSIIGRVFYENKRPAPGATVQIADNPEVAAIADESGIFQISGLAPGFHQLIASRGGYISNFGDRGLQRVEVSAGQYHPCDLPLGLGLALNGVIRDLETGEPIAGALVHVIESESSGKLKKNPAATTGADGAFRLEGLPTGIVTFQALAKGYVCERARASLAAGDANACEIALEPASTVAVKVTDQAGKPLAGARVVAEVSNNPEIRYAKEITTGKQGMAWIREYSATKRPTIEATKPGYITTSGSWSRPVFTHGSRSADVNLVLYLPVKSSPQSREMEGAPIVRTFQGRVTNSEGAPVAGARVYGRLSIEEEEAPAITDADGFYFLTLTRPPRFAVTYHFGAVALGYAFAPNAVSLADSAPHGPAGVDFMLEKGHWAGGTVVDGEGAPLKGMRVRISHEKHPASGEYFPAGRETFTDTHGKFRFDSLPDVGMALTVAGKGWAKIASQKILLDRETALVMKECGVIRGRVVDADTGAPAEAFSIRSTEMRTASGFEAEPLLFCANDGAFILRGLDGDKAYSLEARARGCAAVKIAGIRPSQESSPQVTIFKLVSLGTAQIAGTVFDAVTQKPIAGAEVALYGSDTGDAAPYLPHDEAVEFCAKRLLTGGDGFFSLQGGGRDRIVIRARDYPAFVVLLRDCAQYGGANAMRIGLKRGATVSGTVTFYGRPAANIQAAIYRVRGKTEKSLTYWQRQETRGKSSMTAANGAYRIAGLNEGAYELYITGGEERQSFTKRIALELPSYGEEIVNIDVAGGKSALHGFVLSQGKTMPRCGLSLHEKDKKDATARETMTNEKGEYRFVNLPDGTYTLDAISEDAGCFEYQSDEIEVKGDTRRDIEYSGRH